MIYKSLQKTMMMDRMDLCGAVTKIRKRIIELPPLPNEPNRPRVSEIGRDDVLDVIEKMFKVPAIQPPKEEPSAKSEPTDTELPTVDVKEQTEDPKPIYKKGKRKIKAP